MTRTTNVLLALLFVLAPACDDGSEDEGLQCFDLRDAEHFELAVDNVATCVDAGCEGWEAYPAELLYLSGCISGCIGNKLCESSSDSARTDLYLAAQDQLCAGVETPEACLDH